MSDDARDDGESVGSAGLAGRRLGVYQVQSLLGAGGMGEVYRARDTKLDRDVAIKVLPRHLVADADRRARFEREARMLASLNHPNIAQIYGFEETEGVPALVMELVDGVTLEQRISGLGVADALSIARQIVDALGAAHEKGVIHRDLKPANIKITPDGTVKVLDFGLAKAMIGDASGPDLSQIPTVTSDGTRVGTILGTPAYMSPEQARGKPVDKRTDIWAFGCVLYEMLAGRAAFPGETISDTIAAILEREPDWMALPAGAPTSVRALLRRCLAKDVKRRLHDIGDAGIEIDDVLSGAARSQADTAAVGRPLGPVRLPWSVAAVASLVALISAGSLIWNLRTASPSPTPPPRVLRLAMTTSSAAGVSIANRTLAITSITRDGTYVVYIGNNGRHLFARRLDQLDDAPPIVTAVAPLNDVFLSPDGQYIGFVEGRALNKVALTGGPATMIVRFVGEGATWALDHTIILGGSSQTPGLARVSDGGGAVSVLTQPVRERGELAHVWPEILPGGRAVLFTITATTGGLDAAQVAVLDLATGTYKPLVPGGSHAHYVASGHLVYTVGSTLKAVPFDLERLETSGTPVQVLSRLATTRDGTGAFAVAEDGTLAYVDVPSGPAEESARTLVWVDRQGRERPLGTPPGPRSQPRVSPDGTEVAMVVDGDIWVWDIAGRTSRQLTFDPAHEFFPVWNGRRLIFAKAAVDIFRQAADGSDKAEALGAGPGLPSAVTPDGTRVLFSVLGKDLMTLALDGTPAVTPLVQTESDERNGEVSPDGRWLAYESNSSGQFEIYVKPSPNVNDVQGWKISTAGGTRPVWAPKGQELFYVAPDGALMAVPYDPRGGTWSVAPKQIVKGPYLDGTPMSGRNYDVSASGGFLMVKQGPAADTPEIIIVTNWLEDLKRLVTQR